MSSCVVSVKAVVLGTSHVLLARNHRDEWELPGGRPEQDEEPSETVRREVFEETGVLVSVGDEIHVEDFEVLPGRSVTIRAFRCAPGDADSTRPSHEHTEVHCSQLTRFRHACPTSIVARSRRRSRPSSEKFSGYPILVGCGWTDVEVGGE